MQVMEILEIMNRLERVEAQLPELGVLFHDFAGQGRPMRLYLTDRLRRLARKDRAWCSRGMLSTLKNASYGFHENACRSRRGRDGVFLIDRLFVPRNQLLDKLFDQFLDKRGSGVEDIAGAFGVRVSELVPVGLGSHHMRLLGVLARATEFDQLALVEYYLCE